MPPMNNDESDCIGFPPSPDETQLSDLNTMENAESNQSANITVSACYLHEMYYVDLFGRFDECNDHCIVCLFLSIKILKLSHLKSPFILKTLR